MRPAPDPGFPPRNGNRVSPLILAEEMFPALERLALGARRRLFLAFRIFDPATRTRSDEAREAGLGDWTALIADAVRRGVTVRLLLTDFEPTVAHALHAGSWSSFARLKAMAAELTPDERERLEVIVAQHPGELGWAWRHLLRLPVAWRVRRALIELAAGDRNPHPLDHRPGLWPYARLRDGRLAHRIGPPPRLWPATHHHKFAVADDAVAIVGGIDVDERRWETRAYAQPAPRSWHDVSVLVEGPAAGDAAEHFRRLWNADLPRYVEIARGWMRGSDRELLLDPLDHMPQPISPAPPVPGASARVQMLRTLSTRSNRLFAIGPRKQVRELMAAYRRLIFEAERLIYIEAQFFRSRRAAGWIVEAARRNPALEVIILVPQAPDVVAFEGEGGNPAHQHGEWLQARALGKLIRRLGARVGLYALGRRAPMTREERALVADRGAAFGAGIIYIHSKLLIADDRAALVSSANINNRSFSWDSEFGCLWEEPEGVARFRARLWSQLLGMADGAAPDSHSAAALWRETAMANVQVPPEARQGFVVPYRYARVRRFGRPAWFVPDDLV